MRDTGGSAMSQSHRIKGRTTDEAFHELCFLWERRETRVLTQPWQSLLSEVCDKQSMNLHRRCNIDPKISLNQTYSEISVNSLTQSLGVFFSEIYFFKATFSRWGSINWITAVLGSVNSSMTLRCLYQNPPHGELSIFPANQQLHGLWCAQINSPSLSVIYFVCLMHWKQRWLFSLFMSEGSTSQFGGKNNPLNTVEKFYVTAGLFLLHIWVKLIRYLLFIYGPAWSDF